MISFHSSIRENGEEEEEKEEEARKTINMYRRHASIFFCLDKSTSLPSPPNRNVFQGTVTTRENFRGRFVLLSNSRSRSMKLAIIRTVMMVHARVVRRQSTGSQEPSLGLQHAARLWKETRRKEDQ